MAAQLFYLPFRPAIDANGLTVSGAQLFFYLTGTTTPQTVYADAALTTPLTNPVTANAAGVWPSIYLDDTIVYRVVLKDGNNVTLDDQDPYLADVADDLTTALSNIADAVAADAADASADAIAAEGFRDEAEVFAATALTASGPNYASTAAGLAATSVGDTFAVDNGDNTVTVYRHDAGPVATALRSYPTEVLVVKPSQADHPFSLYGGDGQGENLIPNVIGSNVWFGRDIFTNMTGVGQNGNPNRGYGMNAMGSRIMSQNAINPLDCIAIGYETGLYLGDATRCIAIGAKALDNDKNRTPGILSTNDGAPIDIIALGVTAFFDGLSSSSSGSIAIGTNACREVTRAVDCVYIGQDVAEHLGQTLYNIVIGARAGGGATDAGATNTQHNVIIGWEAVGALRDGTQNIAIGSRAGFTLRDGTTNLLIGYQVMDSLTDGDFNIAIGREAGTAWNSDDAIMIGDRSFAAMVSGARPCGVGQDFAPLATGSDICGIGWNALPNLTTGIRNVAVGAQAGGTNASGSFCLWLGNYTAGIAGGANQNAIGDAATCTKANQFMFGKSTENFEYAFTNGYYKGKVYTVATLPNAATAGAGSRAFVSDTTLTVASSFSVSTTGTGGGANFAPVYSDGSAWRIG